MAEKTKPVFRAVWAAPCRPVNTTDVCDLLCKLPDDLIREITEAFEQTKQKEA